MYIEEKEEFTKWYTKNGWVKLSWNCYSRYNEGGSERWLYGKYLMETS